MIDDQYYQGLLRIIFETWNNNTPVINHNNKKKIGIKRQKAFEFVEKIEVAKSSSRSRDTLKVKVFPTKNGHQSESYTLNSAFSGYLFPAFVSTMQCCSIRWGKVKNSSHQKRNTLYLLKPTSVYKWRLCVVRTESRKDWTCIQILIGQISQKLRIFYLFCFPCDRHRCLRLSSKVNLLHLIKTFF